MSKPQITGIKHTDGRSIKLGGIVVKKFNGADGIVRLTWVALSNFPSILGTFLPRSVVFQRRRSLVPRRGGTTNTLVSCRVLMVASRIYVDFNAPDSGEPTIFFRQEICGMKTFWLANGPVRRQLS